MTIAGQRLPEATIYEGDMLDFDLGRLFDVVTCLFSSIVYVRTADNLLRALRCMAGHVGAGRVVVVEPFFEPGDWEIGHLAALFVEEPSLKIARMNLAERNGDLAIMEFHYLVGPPDGIEHFTERHEPPSCGMTNTSTRSAPSTGGEPRSRGLHGPWSLLCRECRRPIEGVTSMLKVNDAGVLLLMRKNSLAPSAASFSNERTPSSER